MGAALDAAVLLGLDVQVTSVRRSWAQQQKLRDAYLAGKSKFPANAPGDSAHQFGLAFDSWVPEDQRELWQQVREYYGFRVPSNDWIHAELPNWRQYRDQLVRSGNAGR